MNKSIPWLAGCITTEHSMIINQQIPEMTELIVKAIRSIVSMMQMDLDFR